MLHNEKETLAKWAEYNRMMWNCRAEIRRFKVEGTEAYCESLFFLDHRGQLFLPPMNAYHPVIFNPTPTKKSHSITTQWLKVAEAMVREMTKVGCPVNFVFPPDIQDIRPWKWSNYIVDVHYTYCLKLPYRRETLDSSVRRKIIKAQERGYVCRIADKMSDVYECLVETEGRKGFSHRLTTENLELGRKMLGDEILRPYVCYSEQGEPVSASIELILNRNLAVGLMLGTKSEHLQHGATQLITEFMLNDLSALGVKNYDFVGANIPTVAYSKSQWGTELTPYYTVRKRGFKDMLREGKKWVNPLGLLGSMIGIGGI